MLRAHFFFTACVCVTCSITAAANKTDKADRIVDAVLAQEARGAVLRRSDDLSETVTMSDRARWAAGYVRTSDGWQEFGVVHRMNERIREYNERRGTEPLTAKQHLALADWCHDQKLLDQERAHLWAAGSDSSLREGAYRRLGLTRVQGELLSPEDLRKRKASEQQWKADYQRWLPKIKNIAAELSQPNESSRQLGRAQLAEITDASVLPALETFLPYVSPDHGTALIQYLSAQRKNSSTLALARQSVLSPWEPVRALAADELRHRRADVFVPTLVATIMKPLDFNVQNAVVILRKNINDRGVRLECAYVQTITASTEKWQETPIYVYQQVLPTLIFGGNVNGHLQPDTRSDGLIRMLRSKPSGSILPTSTELLSEANAREPIAQANIAIENWNERVSQTLVRGAGFPSNLSVDQIWEEWAQLTATEVPTEKPIIVGNRVEVLEETLTIEDRQWHSCLPAGTCISTQNGMQPVESLHIGDIVLAKDIETGELSYKPVTRTTVRSPQPLVTLHTKDDNIRATLGHYFWVSGQGWRMAKEIKPGDRLHGVQGTVTVTDVSRGGREAVYNLVVEGANTYFVGEGRILSHDVTPPVPTDIVVPGLAAR